MAATEWHPGPPPAPGWYLASVARTGQFYRWWDGQWSVCATPWFDAAAAAAAAEIPAPADVQRRIWWAWPEERK